MNGEREQKEEKKAKVILGKRPNKNRKDNVLSSQTMMRWSGIQKKKPDEPDDDEENVFSLSCTLLTRLDNAVTESGEEEADEGGDASDDEDEEEATGARAGEQELEESTSIFIAFVSSCSSSVSMVMRSRSPSSASPPPADGEDDGNEDEDDNDEAICVPKTLRVVVAAFPLVPIMMVARSAETAWKCSR